MIPLPGIRDKGPGPLLGAKGPHQRGPFGTWPDPDEDDLGDTAAALDLAVVEDLDGANGAGEDDAA